MIQIIQKHYNNGNEVHMLSVVFKKAFDSVLVNDVIEETRRLGMTKKIVRVDMLLMRSLLLISKRLIESHILSTLGEV